MIMDHYREKWTPYTEPYANPNTLPSITWPFNTQPAITDAEILEFRKLLDRAREYDKRNNEPDCELAEKRQAILDIAKKLGVDIAFL
jgi:hypothetical protein